MVVDWNLLGDAPASLYGLVNRVPLYDDAAGWNCGRLAGRYRNPMAL